MRLTNVGLPVGAVVDVSAEHGEYLLKLFGRKFVAVADVVADAADGQPIGAGADVSGQAVAASEPDKPRLRGKAR